MRRLAGFLLATALLPGSYTVTLTPQEAQYLGGVLRKQPFEQVAPLILNLQRQLDEQDKAVQPKEQSDGKAR